MTSRVSAALGAGALALLLTGCSLLPHPLIGTWFRTDSAIGLGWGFEFSGDGDAGDYVEWFTRDRGPAFLIVRGFWSADGWADGVLILDAGYGTVAVTTYEVSGGELHLHLFGERHTFSLPTGL